MSSLRSIKGATWRAELRMRLARVLAVLPTALSLALAASAVVLAVRKLWPGLLPDRWAVGILIGAGALVVLTVLVALLRRLPPYAGALALDSYHRLNGRLTNALEFSATAPAERSPFMALAIADACKNTPKTLSARRAVRIPVPPELAVSAVLALAVVGLYLLEVRLIPKMAPVAKQEKIDPLEMSPDDLELFKEAAEELKRQDQNPEVAAAIERFNQLIEDIARRRINRTEAFRRMREIESRLLEGAEADKLALQEALKETAKELQKSKLAQPLAKSLEQNKLDQAQQDLKQLADTLKGKKGTKQPSKAELERLRRALDRAASQHKKALAAINEERAKIREDLLKKKKPKKPQSEAEKKREEDLLKKKQDQLKRLDREAKKRERAMQQLSRLDRELAKAAEDLLRDLGLSAEDLEQAAEDLNRLERERMSDKEKEELRRRLQELRELIRQQGQGGKKRLKLMKRFGQKARGRKPGQGQRPGQGKQGDGSGDGDLRRQRPGGGPGDRPGGLMPGEGGGKIPIPVPGGGSGSEDGDGPGGPEAGGKGIGHSPGGDPKGKATDPKGMETVDVRAEGLDTKQGPTNSKVILTAAERGFKGKPYQRVYKDYRTVAEDQITKEKIPDGFRFYVRRYFQLIRPRE